MTKLACQLKKVVHTSTGHTVFFPGNKGVVEVPEHLVADCIKEGAYVLPGQEVPSLAEAPPEKIEYNNDERKSRSIALFKKMLESPEEHRLNFTAAGRPKSRYVEKTLGFKIMPQEVEAWWLEAQP